MPSSENLFSTLHYALFAAPAAVVLVWVAWRVMVWCLYYARLVSAWLAKLPVLFQLPILVGLLLLTWPLLLLALVAWILVLLFPGLAPGQGEVPRVFTRNRSKTVSYLFLFFLPLPLVCVPMKILADRVEGPQIGVWHWLLVFGPIPLLAGWLIAWIRRKPDWS